MPTRRLRCESLEDRLTPALAGALDLTFGVGGIATTTFAGRKFYNPAAIAVQPDGKIVVAGSAGPSATDSTLNDFAAARLNPDGTPDTTFGDGGTVIIPFDINPGANKEDRAQAVAVEPDGQIVLAGFATTGDGSLSAAVARLNPDGSLDPTFGTGGKFTGGSRLASSMAVQSDGKIVLGGFGVMRLTADGQLDPTFGTGGVVGNLFDDVAGSNPDFVYGVAVEPGGRIVAVGTPDRGRIDSDLAAAGLTPSGVADPSFGTDGTGVRIDGSGHNGQDTVGGIATGGVNVTPDGSLVIVGRTDILTPTYTSYIWAVRLTSDGKLDAGFGIGGRVAIPESVSDVTGAAGPDGTVALVSLGETVTRLTAQGAVDKSFGFGGRSFIRGLLVATSAAVQPDGSVLVAGARSSTDGSITSAVVIRLRGQFADTPVPVPPGPALAGGQPDGTAVPLTPTGDGTYQAGETFTALPGFTGAVRVATADVTGDGVPDRVVGAGPGGEPRVAVIDGKTGDRLTDFPAFERSFTGGVFVAAGDIDGDGRAEVVVTPDRGGGPIAAVYTGASLPTNLGFPISNGLTEVEVVRFFGIDDPDFRGGARPTIGDVNGDGIPDLVVAAGYLGGPRVAIFDGKSVAAGDPVPSRLVADFFAFETTLRNGTFVSAGVVDGDGAADLAFGGGPDGAPRVRLFDGKALLAASPFANLDEGADRPAGQLLRRGQFAARRAATLVA